MDVIAQIDVPLILAIEAKTNPITQIALPLILAFIMFSMGITLVVDDFKRVAKFPKAFLVGSFLQMVTLPLLAFGLATVWMKYNGLEAAYAVGLLIIAACPGGVTSNLMAHMCKGDTALSISLTAIISLVTVITIPVIVNLGLGHFMGAEDSTQLPVAKTVAGIFAITTVPVLIGMLVKNKAPDWSLRNEALIGKLAAIFFVIILVAAIAKDWKLLVSSFSSVGPLTLALNVATLVFGYGVSRLLSLDRKQAVTITFECGLQNGTLAIFIALTLLHNEQMMIPCGVYSILMFITGGALMGLFRVTEPKEDAAVAA